MISSCQLMVIQLWGYWFGTQVFVSYSSGRAFLNYSAASFPEDVWYTDTVKADFVASGLFAGQVWLAALFTAGVLSP